MFECLYVEEMSSRNSEGEGFKWATQTRSWLLKRTSTGPQDQTLDSHTPAMAIDYPGQPILCWKASCAPWIDLNILQQKCNIIGTHSRLFQSKPAGQRRFLVMECVTFSRFPCLFSLNDTFVIIFLHCDMFSCLPMFFSFVMEHFTFDLIMWLIAHIQWVISWVIGVTHFMTHKSLYKSSVVIRYFWHSLCLV